MSGQSEAVLDGRVYMQATEGYVGMLSYVGQGRRKLNGEGECSGGWEVGKEEREVCTEGEGRGGVGIRKGGGVEGYVRYKYWIQCCNIGTELQVLCMHYKPVDGWYVRSEQDRAMLGCQW